MPLIKLLPENQNTSLFKYTFCGCVYVRYGNGNVLSHKLFEFNTTYN